jgi:hypothetical protein
MHELEADEEDLFHLAASPFHDLETATLPGIRCGYVNRSGHPLLPEAKPLFTVRTWRARPPACALTPGASHGNRRPLETRPRSRGRAPVLAPD